MLQVVDDEAVGVHRSETYSSILLEKQARGALKAAVERGLNKTTIVIVDALNYIKGFRYELYCLARALGVPHCVVHVAVSDTQSAEWNLTRIGAQYPAAVIKELVVRYECPNSNSRWDKPVFTVTSDDDLPVVDIDKLLLDGVVEAPAQATQSQRLSAIHELDRATQDVVKEILHQQIGRVPGEALLVSNSDDKYNYIRTVTMSELRRLRQQVGELGKGLIFRFVILMWTRVVQFISLTKMHPPEHVNRLPTMFVQFINNAL